MTVAAEIIQIGGAMGVKGVSRVRCKVVGHPGDRPKILTRNIVGPVRVGDIIVLKETSMENEGGFSR